MSPEIEIIERTVPISWANGILQEIERINIDINAIIAENIKEHGIFDIDTAFEEQQTQKRFVRREARIIFKLLRKFPNNSFLIGKVQSLIQNTTPPWRILSYAEKIPTQLYVHVIQQFETYMETNARDIFKKLEICEAIGKQLSHIASFPVLDLLLQKLVASLPSEIAFRIVCGQNFNDAFETLLYERCRGFENHMTEAQRKKYDTRKKFHEATKYSPWESILEFSVEWKINIVQFFPKDADGHRSYAHSTAMLLWLWFSHTDLGWIHIFRNGEIEIACNSPEIGDDDTIDFIFETLSQKIDMCVIRGHSWVFEINDIFAKTACEKFIFWGCDGSKILRKDIRKDNEESEKIQRKCIAVDGIGTMKKNDLSCVKYYFNCYKTREILIFHIS